MMVRITPYMAAEYSCRGVFLDCAEPGLHTIPEEIVRDMIEDCRHQMDPTLMDDMTPGHHRAYRALYRQLTA